MTHQHGLECRDLMKHLNDYIDGDLDEDLCGKIEAHIDSCPNCRIVVNTLKKTIQLYQDDGESVSLPMDARHRLFEALDLDEDADLEK